MHQFVVKLKKIHFWSLFALEQDFSPKNHLFQLEAFVLL